MASQAYHHNKKTGEIIPSRRKKAIAIDAHCHEKKTSSGASSTTGISINSVRKTTRLPQLRSTPVGDMVYSRYNAGIVTLRIHAQDWSSARRSHQ